MSKRGFNLDGWALNKIMPFSYPDYATFELSKIKIVLVLSVGTDEGRKSYIHSKSPGVKIY